MLLNDYIEVCGTHIAQLINHAPTVGHLHGCHFSQL